MIYLLQANTFEVQRNKEAVKVTVASISHPVQQQGTSRAPSLDGGQHVAPLGAAHAGLMPVPGLAV